MEYIIVKPDPLQIEYKNCNWFTKKCKLNLASKERKNCAGVLDMLGVAGCEAMSV